MLESVNQIVTTHDNRMKSMACNLTNVLIKIDAIQIQPLP